MATTSHTLRQRAGVLLVLLGLIAAMAPVTLAHPAFANAGYELSDPQEDPVGYTGPASVTEYDGNDDATICATDETYVSGGNTSSSDPALSDSEGDIGVIDITVSGKSWDFSVVEDDDFEGEILVMSAISKGGPGFFEYDYRPDGTMSDSGLESPVNNNKQNDDTEDQEPAGLSHTAFCVTVERDTTTTQPNLELLKVWQDEQGYPVEAPSDVFWSAGLRYGAESQTEINIGSDTGIRANTDIEEGRTRYVVVERDSEEFDEVVCSDAVEARVNTGIAEGRPVDFGGTGTYATPEVDTLHVICNQLTSTPEQPNLELLKVWLDADGELVAAPDDVFWSAGLRYGAESETEINIGSDTGIRANTDIEEGRTRYVVVERDSEVFDEVTCPTAVEDRVGSGIAGDRAVNYDGTGTYATPEVDTLHVICNQLRPELTVEKVWTGDDADGSAVFEVTFWTDGPSSEVSEFDGVPQPVDVADGDSIVIPPYAYRVSIDERVSGLGACTFDLVDVSDDRDLPENGEFDRLELSEVPDYPYDEYLYAYEQMLSSFTVTFTNDVDCPSITSTPSRAFVEVLKEWTVDGTVVDASEGATPEFDVALSLGDDEVATDTVAAGETASFIGGLTSGTTYDVTVTEDAATLPEDPFSDDTRTCEFVETTYSLTDPTVTASATGGNVTVTATNAYACTEVEGEGFSTLDVDIDKQWRSTTAGEGLVPLAAPADHTPTFEVTLTDADGAAIGEPETLTPGETVTFSDLADGAEYDLEWTEVNPLASFTNADGETCTMNDDASVIAGRTSVVGGDDTSVTLEARNAYDCPAVMGVSLEDDAEEIADTGVPALLLTLIGLSSMGLGGGLLRRTKRS